MWVNTHTTSTECGARRWRTVVKPHPLELHVVLWMTNKWYLSFFPDSRAKRDKPENTDRWRVKRKLALLLIKLVGKHGFKCGLKRLEDTTAKFKILPPVDPGPAHTTGSSFPLAEQKVWSEGHISLKWLSLALLSSVSWPHQSDGSLMPTGAKNKRWWAVFPNNFHLWGIECTLSALFRTSQVSNNVFPPI